MKQKILTILAILVFLAGISLLAYPVVSNLLYEKEQEELMEHYDSIVGENLTADEQAAELQECRDYNRGLLQRGVLLTDPFDMSQLDPSALPYAGLLNVDEEGGMAYLRIPAIDVELMIYHGTEEEVLQKGVGHLQGSPFPWEGQEHTASFRLIQDSMIKSCSQTWISWKMAIFFTSMCWGRSLHIRWTRSGSFSRRRRKI